MKKFIFSDLKNIHYTLFTYLCLSFVFIGFSNPAKAQYSATINQIENGQQNQQNSTFTPTFVAKINRDLTELTEQMSAVSITVTGIIGTFFDAKHQMQVQTLLDQYYIDARRDYQPSTALCRFGSTRTGLISSDLRGHVNTEILAQSATLRETLNRSRMPLKDIADEVRSRVFQFQRVYCNPHQLGGTLGGTTGAEAVEGICDNATSPPFYDIDMNYTRLIDNNLTLDVNLTDDELTDDERDVRSLMNNLFSYKTFPVMTNDFFLNNNNAEKMVKMRSIMASRSLARNSLSHIIGKRSRGTGVPDSFISDYLKTMGYTTSDVQEMMGEDPSYEAQMEFLTKKMYQQPNFINSLIDTPENVKRQDTAILASKLMLDRDISEALQRRELLMSAILNELLKDEEEFIINNLRVN